MKLLEALTRLRQPVPNNLISQRKVGGQVVDYVSWFTYCDLLDDRIGYGCWFWEVLSMSQIGDRLTLVGRLTIIGDDRELSMMATGSESINCSSYGDPSSNAEAMSLRRALAKFGLTRDLWRKEDKSKPPTPTLPEYKKQPPRPRAGTSRNTRSISREEWLALKANQI